MNNYIPTIGLEIHAELKTETKMFCNSKNNPDESEPNKNICPICTGQPGTLPTINKEAVKHVLKVGLAVGGNLADFTEFDRKNYFYPDIPKGYQISQYKYPLVSGGEINKISLTRIHLEEDTATSLHERGEYSLVDFNRAGLPLLELVTEPVIHSAEDASAFAKELQLLLQYLGASDSNMEKGEMRIEANISVGVGKELGVKVEVKNLNSFKSVEQAIEYEIKRQIELLEGGGRVQQETRGWDEKKEETFVQRAKESSHDYRYFPDPDLPKLYISQIPEFDRGLLLKEISELPWEKRGRYEDLGLKTEDINFFLQSRNKFFDGLFQKILKFSGDVEIVKLSVNYITSDMVGLAKRGVDLDIDHLEFIKLMTMVKENKISSRGAKDILAILVGEGGDVEKIAEENNLLQKSDERELKEIVRKIIEENPKVVEEYRSGKESVLQYLVGQGMKETRGAGNPQVLKDLFLDLLV